MLIDVVVVVITILFIHCFDPEWNGVCSTRPAGHPPAHPGAHWELSVHPRRSLWSPSGFSSDCLPAMLRRCLQANSANSERTASKYHTSKSIQRRNSTASESDVMPGLLETGVPPASAELNWVAVDVCSFWSLHATPAGVKQMEPAPRTCHSCNPLNPCCHIVRVAAAFACCFTAPRSRASPATSLLTEVMRSSSCTPSSIGGGNLCGGTKERSIEVSSLIRRSITSVEYARGAAFRLPCLPCEPVRRAFFPLSSWMQRSMCNCTDSRRVPLCCSKPFASRAPSLPRQIGASCLRNLESSTRSNLFELFL
mmetsp:Transcript_50833/g.94085  ORF Transcript_50833/g.94085 Transcript_50833/m.94085 type:complete len:310 (+) Transcript_50833:32-961(+)